MSKVYITMAVDCDNVPYGWRKVWYRCPGCKDLHNVDLREGGRTGPSWTFNEDSELPTFTPSVNYTARVCHHFVTGGKIQFCGDSTHPLSGQTVELPDIDKWAKESGADLEYYCGKRDATKEPSQ